ncbi:hypothetical protein BGZ52_009328 [Haplosporangium bisporale]|nr:hypothetical protein BGZ52_009328 [Haplosporangium bisporale]
MRSSTISITCHLTLNDPLAIHRSKLIKTYNLIEPRFGPVLVALKHLVVHRHIDTYHFIPFSTYALELMLITFLQTENPPILPKLQQPTPHEDGDEERPLKELIVQGIDCSFDRDWAYYQGFGNRNTKTVAELVLDFCRFFGYVFDYESKEVNARIGAFRWRPDLTRTHTSLAMTSSGPTAGPSTGSSTSTATAIPGFLSRSNSSSSVTTQGSMSRLESVSYAGLVFHVMDPFMVSLNITAPCQGERVRMMKECFQEAYEALNEGDINLAFAHSSH